MQLLTSTGAPGMGMHMEGVDFSASRWGVVVTTWPVGHETERRSTMPESVWRLSASPHP